MSMIRASHTLDSLDRDIQAMPRKAAVSLAKVVASNARDGNRRAKAFARVSSGKTGRLYPDAFTAEALSAFAWEYGPDASKKQGGMSFEFGSRNQPPHLDLAKSADIVGPKLAADVRDVLDRLFW